MEELLKRVWPFLRVLVAARLATYLKTLGVRLGVTLSDEDAVSLAALIVTEITTLLNRPGDPETDALIQKAGAALGVVEPA